jgi:CRISPR-associated protein Cas8b/Csh1 subtype I-B
MLSPEEFREEYSKSDLAAVLPDSSIGSLRDIQYLYGKLYILGTTGGGEYAPYLTPDAAGDLIDTDDSLIVIRVDLSGDEPVLADDERGSVWVTRYSEDLVRAVGHCYYQNRGAGIDHSITHRSGRSKSPERLGEYAKHRFTRWPTEDAIVSVSETHEDGDILEDLAAIGERSDFVTEIKEEVQRQLGGNRTSLITVQVRTEPGGEYRWPADIDVLMDAMRTQRISKLVTKNQANDSSGAATDLITGRETRTVGTAQDPQNYFLGKQREKFPGLDIEKAWRSHPISEDAAVTVMNAEAFVEACTYRTFGTKVYYLPYVWGQVSPENARELYELLYYIETEDDEMTPVERAYGERSKLFGDAELRFYVSAVMPHQTSRYDVFGETLNGRLLYPKALATEHNRLVEQSSAFQSETDWTAPLPTHESWDLLAGDDNRLHSVSTGWYFYQTFAERDDEDADNDDAEADADDPRIEALVAVLGGDSISVETLLGEYVDRIVSEQTDEENDGFPSYSVAGQFAQLCALATDELDLLTTDDEEKRPITREPTYEEYTMEAPTEILAADGGHPAAQKLESFIEDTPALAHDEDAPRNDQRRGAFLLGALVGEIGSYQEYDQQRSTTLVDQFPVKSITSSRIKKVTQETIGKTLTYTRQEKKSGRSYPGTKAEHIVERLREAILTPDPDEWELDTDDLRFYYALGVTYGMNDHPEWDSVATDNTEEAI